MHQKWSVRWILFISCLTIGSVGWAQKSPIEQGSNLILGPFSMGKYSYESHYSENEIDYLTFNLNASHFIVNGVLLEALWHSAKT